MFSEYRCGRGGREPSVSTRRRLLACALWDAELSDWIVATAGSRLGKPCAGFLRISECGKTRAARSVVAVALALAAEEIISGNREPTGDKTNLISAKVHQSDSFFLASALFFVAFVRRAEQQQKKQLIRASL